MRLVVLGTTGRTGRLGAGEARGRGRDVVALVRHEPDTPLHPSIVVAVVDVRDQDAVATQLAGADAVVAASGAVAGAAVTEVARTKQAVVDAMGRTGVRRIVVAANRKVLSDDDVTGEY